MQYSRSLNDRLTAMILDGFLRSELVLSPRRVN